jgi:hypothetical protein
LAYAWPAARSGDEPAYGNLRGNIEASDQAEAESIVRNAFDEARNLRDKVAATGSDVWPGVDMGGPVRITPWPDLTIVAYPV